MLLLVCYVLVSSLILSQISLLDIGKQLGIKGYLMPLDIALDKFFAWHTWLIVGALSTLTALIYFNNQQLPEIVENRTTLSLSMKVRRLRRKLDRRFRK